MKLGLGTVQFGTNYGISNESGQTTKDEAAAVLKIAESNGIRVLDTARLYGTSEMVLGGLLHAGHPFRIITKTVKFNGDTIRREDSGALLDGFQHSLMDLGQDVVYGLLMHQAADLLKPNGAYLYEAMCELRDKHRKVQKIGVSVYTPEEANAICDMFPIDLIQLPMSVFDQRFISSGVLHRLREARVEIHTRSVFLQGLMLMAPEHLHPYFSPILPLIRSYREALASYGLTGIEAALDFANKVAEVDTILVGVNDNRQLEELISQKPSGLSIDFYSSFAIEDIRFVNPALWKLSY